MLLNAAETLIIAAVVIAILGISLALLDHYGRN